MEFPTKNPTITSLRPTFEPLTPFHFRDQLWELLCEPGDIQQKLLILSTSRSRYGIREKLWTALSRMDGSSTTLETQAPMEAVKAALQAKLNQEGRTGFHFGIIADGNRRWAKSTGNKPNEGHKHGFITIEKTIFLR